LGEIEAVLRQHQRVAEGLVVQNGESGGEHLVAYVVASDGSTGNAEWLRPYLQDRLPSFMVPAHLVAVARFPLTAAGKIDASELPDPISLRASATGDFLEPRTDTERTVASIFSDLLLIDRIGADADFFDIGGHSLLATRLLSRLRAAFPIELSLRTLFENATVEAISAAIDSTMARGTQT
jgi:acyl carrier protein